MSEWPIERIEDFEDPRIDEFRNLKDGQLASKRGRFIVEGHRNLRVMLSRSPFVPESILLSERAFASLAPELETSDPVCPIRVAARDLLDRVVGFPVHRGCLAACERPPARNAESLVREVLEANPSARFVVLEGVTNHDNVGGIFRSAMAFGVDGVLLCPRTGDPLYRKAIRTSMGGSLCVPFARAEEIASLLGFLRASDVQVWALDPAPEGAPLHESPEPRNEPIACVFGSEGDGVSQATLDLADRRVRIEIESDVDSLNVSVAAGIALHALRTHDSTSAGARDRRGSARLPGGREE